jgi:pilus assembly protein CpaD
MIRISARSIAPLALAAALAACASPKAPSDGPRAGLTSLDQYPLKTEQHPDEVRLAAHVDGLSGPQRQALIAFHRRWSEADGGPITIKMPVTEADADTAAITGEASRQLLLQLGVPSDKIVRAGYDSDEPGRAPVIVTFSVAEAVVPTCGRTWDNLTATRNNTASVNFGCAVAANMAAQIADAADIDHPRAEDPADAVRRGAVLTKYRAGETTSTAKDAQASASTSASAP